MIEYIKFKLALRKFNKYIESVRKKYNEDVSVAKKEKKSNDDIRFIEHNAWHEERMYNEEISIIVTQYLLSKARKHFLPIPPREESEMWEQCNQISTQFVLTNAGVTKVRSFLRTESKERKEVILTYIAAFTGLIGAATGLIAVFGK